MDYEGFFRERLDALHAEGRYRLFADLERRCGRFPRAFDHRIGAEVTVWCSNDYLGTPGGARGDGGDAGGGQRRRDARHLGTNHRPRVTAHTPLHAVREIDRAGRETRLCHHQEHAGSLSRRQH